LLESSEVIKTEALFGCLELALQQNHASLEPGHFGSLLAVGRAEGEQTKLGKAEVCASQAGGKIARDLPRRHAGPCP
jgi:hypothetical protein